ncbi:MAG TPA: S-layer homology domain-containing protein [Bacillota bacterium]|nr:MAG: Outer membrane protein alpha precursor [Firmicutes bacterium ADurb.Bin153]HNV34982.1 S-layer homology domain-containing protein [Bacillota bacterium]
MKRTVAMLIAVLIAMAVVMPAMASPYPDVSDLHWASESVGTLTALGILEGYPDGTFKGPQPTTRYEIAVMIARLLKYLDQQITARVAEVEKKIPTAAEPAPVTTPTPVPTPAPVTTVVQVEPDQTILETIIREKIEALVGPKLEDIDERIAELYAMIQDLRTEFSREISILGVRVDALDEQLKQLAAKVAKNEADIAALKLQLDPAVARIAGLEKRADATDKQLADLNAAIAKLGVPTTAGPAPIITTIVEGATAQDLDAVKKMVLALEKDKVDVLSSKLGVLDSKVLALESKLNNTDTMIGMLELRTSEIENWVAKVGKDVEVVSKQAEQNATDIIDLYELNYKNADDINALKADMAAKFAAIEGMMGEHGDMLTKETGLNKEGLALLRLDLLQAQDDIDALKPLVEQVNYLYGCCDAIDAKLEALDEKVAMLNMDLVALESEKVNNAILRIELLEPQVAELLEKYGTLAADVQRNSDDINDLYIQQNHTTNIMNNLVAADAAMNERVSKLEAENKIKADELSAKVAALEAAAKTSAADALSLKSGLMGLTDTLSKLWVNKFLLSGSLLLEFKDVAVQYGTPFVDPFDNSDPLEAIVPTNKYYAKLSLTGTITPEPGVEINVGINADLDTYGIADATAYVYSGDIDVKVTGPNGSGQLLGGELTRPKYINKYVMSAIKFKGTKYEGLEGWMKYTPELIDDMTLGASAILGKLGSSTDFNYVWGLAGNANYADVVDLTLYYLAIDDRPFSGDTTVTYSEKNIGVNLDLKLADNWSAGAFANVLLATGLPLPESAVTAYIEGKAGVWNTSVNFERVGEAYAPSFVEFADDEDPEMIENDIMNLEVSNSIDVLPNLVFGLDTGFYGDSKWADMTHTNEVYAKYSFGKETSVASGSLKIYGGRESDIIKAGVWNVPVPEEDAFCYAGANLDLKLYIFNAGFQYYTETYDVGGLYAGINNKYKAYINTELDLITDVLKAKAGWEGVFGDFTAKNYQKAYGELSLNTTFFMKWNLAANLGVYFKSTTMFKAYADAKLTYNITDKASLYAKANFEYRNSVSAADPDGFVMGAGIGYNQKIFNATSLVATFDTKYVKYTYNPGGYADNLVNTLGIKLSTTF